MTNREREREREKETQTVRQIYCKQVYPHDTKTERKREGERERILKEEETSVARY